MVEPVVKVLPHSPEEFKDAGKLSEWIGKELKTDGIYLIASVRKVKDLCPGSICLFMKDKRTVGEGIVKEFKPYSGREKSPVTGKPYEAVITFDPSSLRRYVKPLELITIRDLTGRMLNFRSGGNLTWAEYGKCQAQIVKNGFC